jgi:hypothetical protein
MIGDMKKKWYSPQLERGVVRALYFEAKARHVRMTTLVNRLVRAALRYEGIMKPSAIAIKQIAHRPEEQEARSFGSPRNLGSRAGELKEAMRARLRPPGLYRAHPGATAGRRKGKSNLTPNRTRK